VEKAITWHTFKTSQNGDIQWIWSGGWEWWAVSGVIGRWSWFYLHIYAVKYVLFVNSSINWMQLLPGCWSIYKKTYMPQPPLQIHRHFDLFWKYVTWSLFPLRGIVYSMHLIYRYWSILFFLLWYSLFHTSCSIGIQLSMLCSTAELV
jgi:hypothetical protein